MTNLELLESLRLGAEKYRKGARQSLERNRHMNEIEQGELVQQRIIDAVLVDFVNFVASSRCIDYGLYVQDLQQ